MFWCTSACSKSLSFPLPLSPSLCCRIWQFSLQVHLGTAQRWTWSTAMPWFKGRAINPTKHTTRSLEPRPTSFFEPSFPIIWALGQNTRINGSGDRNAPRLPSLLLSLPAPLLIVLWGSAEIPTAIPQRLLLGSKHPGLILVLCFQTQVQMRTGTFHLTSLLSFAGAEIQTLQQISTVCANLTWSCRYLNISAVFQHKSGLIFLCLHPLCYPTTAPKNVRNEQRCLFLSGTFHVFRSTFSTIFREAHCWAWPLGSPWKPKLDLTLVGKPKSRSVPQNAEVWCWIFAHLGIRAIPLVMPHGGRRPQQSGLRSWVWHRWPHMG